MILAALIYLVFGLLLMTYMCPCWHPFEWLIGAIIWPVAAVIGIVVMIKDAKQGAGFDDRLLVLQVGMLIIMAEEAVRKEQERAKEVSQAQASVDQAAPDEHGGMGQGLPC